MIAFDATEYRDGSTMPQVQGAIVIPDLESLCGCDVIISPMNMPMSKPALIREHLDNKAILVQLKRNMDLPSSIRDQRLNLSLAKMKEFTSNSFQRWLIFAGILTNKENDGQAWIDGRKVDEFVPGMNYAACNSAILHWQMRGGRYMNIAKLSDLPAMLLSIEKFLIECIDKPVLDIIPSAPILQEDSDDPFQLVKRITDARIALSYLIGPVKAQKMYTACKGDIAQAFEHLSNPEDWPYLPKGVFKSDAEKFVERMGLNGRIMQVRQPYSKGDDY